MIVQEKMTDFQIEALEKSAEKYNHAVGFCLLKGYIKKERKTRWNLLRALIALIFIEMGVAIAGWIFHS